MTHGFTLIELLVVITIIAVLLALLTPALDKAIEEAELAKCSANFHSIGQGMYLYLGDSRRFYPILHVWRGLLGKPAEGAETNEGGRPLNRYVGFPPTGSEVPVAQCPSDKGDPLLVGINNSYREGGSSYLPCFTPHPTKWEPKGYAGVKFVFGYSGFYGRYPQTYNTFSVNYNTPTPSVRQTSLERLDNKMLLADLPWYMDRPTAHLKTRWHRPENDKRLINTMFADGSAELLDWRADIFDPSVTGIASSPTDKGYNSSWDWW